MVGQSIIAAWKLYQKASTNQLQMILLGDTKIRSDAEFLMNFGLVSNTNTPQEAKDIKLVEELMAKRAAIARNSISSVSMGGYPRWSGRGDELFYVEGDALMSARVHAQPAFKFDVPEKLFEWKHLGLYFTRRFDPSTDALRFLAVQETSLDQRFMNIMERWHRARGLGVGPW